MKEDPCDQSVAGDACVTELGALEAESKGGPLTGPRQAGA